MSSLLWVKVRNWYCYAGILPFLVMTEEYSIFALQNIFDGRIDLANGPLLPGSLLTSEYFSKALVGVNPKYFELKHKHNQTRNIAQLALLTQKV